MTDILIFESDLEFAHALHGELARQGCDVSVVSDATEGLQRAASKKPDLILLCTELPRMNGFSVCNRLKRNPELQEVPVIIMSANASEETFQQHRNLTKKRAQDYVHKPIGVAEMVDRVGRFVQLTPGAARSIPPAPPPPRAPEGESLEELDLEDMEEIVDDGLDDLAPGEFDAAAAASGSSAPERAAVSSLPPGSFSPSAPAPSASAAPPSGNAARALSSAPPKWSSAPPKDPSSSPRPLSSAPSDRPAPASASSTEQSGDDNAPASNRRSSRAARRRSSVAPAPVQSVPPAARVPMISEPSVDGMVSVEQVAELEQTLADTRAKLEAVYLELDEARSRESSGAVKAREILDLREALNKKDKELLDLRDQLTRRDKELLASKDAALDFERKNAELTENVVELEKRIHAAERAQQAATQDREQANKRADGYKRKLEKALENIEELSTGNKQLDTELKQTQQRAADLQADLNDAEKELASLEEQVDQTQGKLRQASSELATTQQQLQDSQVQLGAAQARLTRHDSAHDDLKRLLAEALGRISNVEGQR